MKKLSCLFPLAFLLVSVMAAPAALTDGLVSYWPLDATNAATTPDVSFTNTMSVVGPVTVSAGQVSNAFTFNGSSTYLTNLHATDNSASGLPIYRAGTYTITMWVKGPAQTAKYLYSEASTTSNNPLLILQTGQAAANSNKFDVIIRNDAAGTGGTLVNHIVTATVVFDNTWHHIAWVDNRGSVKVFVDGNLDSANFSYTPAGTFTMNTTAIGTLVRAAIATGNIFNGQIDELAIWERALSQAEVNQVRTNGIPTPIVPGPPGLFSVPADAVKHVGDWHLFSVSAYGIRPHNVLSYQWSRNGSPILDATTATYQALNLQTNNTGDFYSVSVSNDLGGAVTTNATLTVLPDPAPDLTNGLVNYWPLDVITQSDTNLFSPEMHYGQSMVLRNFADTNSYVAGRYSNALAFDSVSQYAYRTNGSPIYNNTNYSVSLWVKAPFASQNDRRVFSEGSILNNNPLFALGTDNANPPTTPSATVFIRNDAGVNAALAGRKSTRAVFDDTWHLLTWTDANGQGKLYVDGMLDETDYTYTRSTLTLNLTVLGAVARAPLPVSYYFGNIDEVATWSRVLSWTEIQQVFTNGIPIPQGIVAPSILTQPSDQTNNVYVADDVTFSVQANGTEPLSYQWRKNGFDISSLSNPSAITPILTLTNVQIADSNTTYSVVITNAAGNITSSTARLYVIPWTAITNGQVLAVDFGLNGSTNPQPGFAEMTLATNPGTFANAVKVTLSGIGNIPLAERNRVAGAMVPNTLYMSQAQLYNDFIFGNDGTFTDGRGLRVLIERLAPNTVYGVTIWSFDPQSTPARISDWTETASGTPVIIQTGYTFDGAIQPTNDFEQTLGGLLTSSATGKLQIEALRNGGTSFGCFINAIRLVANPVPTSHITRLAFVNGNIRFNVVGEYPGQPISIQQNTNLVNGTWVPATGGGILSVNGMVSVAEFPVTETQLFYRVSTP